MKSYTHRYQRRRYWSFLQSFMLTTVALFIAQQVFSTNYYARVNGNWNDQNTWSLNSRSGKIAGAIPSATDNVYITGYIVSVSQNNAAAASITITNKFNDDARLLVQNGKALTISGDIFVTAHNRNKTADIWVQGNHSALKVGGDITILRTKDNMHSSSNQIMVSGTSKLLVHGDVAFTLQSSDPGYTNNVIVMNDNAKFICDSNLILRMAMVGDFNVALNDNSSMQINGDLKTFIKAGKNFELKIKDNASLHVNRNFLLNQIGGERVTISVENTTPGVNQFTVNGNFSILHEVGGHLNIQAINNGEIFVKRDFMIDWTGSSISWSELKLAAKNEGAINVTGSMNVNMLDQYDGKLMVDVDDNARFSVGFDNGKLLQSAIFNLEKGSVFDFRLDQNAIFTTFGNLELYNNGSLEMFLLLNQEGSSNSKSAKLAVKGNLIINKTNGSQSYFEIGQNGHVKIDGDANLLYTNHNDLMQINILHLEQNAIFEVLGNFNSTLDDKLTTSLVLNLKDNSHFKVGDASDKTTHLASFNVVSGYQLILNIDNDATLEVNGDFTNNFNGSGPFDINVNFKEDGTSHDGQININGNWNINKTNGDRLRINTHENSVIHVTKNLNIISTNHDLGDFSNEAIILKGKSNIQLDGSLNYTLNEPSQQNNLILNLEDQSKLTIGVNNQKLKEAFNVNLNGGKTFDLDINGDAIVQVYGDFNLTQKAGNELEIDLNKKSDLVAINAQLLIARHFNINKSESSQLLLHGQKNSAIVINGNFSCISNDHATGEKNDERILLEGASKMSVKGNFNFQMNDPLQENTLKIVLRNNALLNTGTTTNDSTVLTTVDGLNMKLILEDNAIWRTSGDFKFNYLAGLEASTIVLNPNMGLNAQLIIGNNLVLNNIQDESAISVLLNQNNSLLHVNGDIDMRSAMYSDRINIILENTAKVELGGDFLRGEEPYLYGSFICNGNSTLAFVGNKTQIFPQTRADGTDAFIYKNILVQNTSPTSPQIILQGDAYIEKNISFVQGIVLADIDSKLVLMENGTVNSASNTSYVDGVFGKVGNAAFTFPIGDGGFYAPLSISESKGKSSQFDAQYIYNSAHSAGYDTSYSSTEIANISTSEYWVLNRPYGDANVAVTLGWDFLRSENIGNSTLCDIKIAHWDGSTWQNEGNGLTTGNASAGSVTTGNKNNCESVSKITSWVYNAPLTLATKPKNVLLDGFVLNIQSTSSVEK